MMTFYEVWDGDWFLFCTDDVAEADEWWEAGYDVYKFRFWA